MIIENISCFFVELQKSFNRILNAIFIKGYQKANIAKHFRRTHGTVSRYKNKIALKIENPYGQIFKKNALNSICQVQIYFE